MGDTAGPWWEFRALGPVDARSRQGSIHTRPMSRALLGLLLTRANQVVRADLLIEELWKGAPPAAAGNALRVHVANLRDAFRAVADDGATVPVCFTNGGYQLLVEPGSFDVEQFEACVRDGRSALESGAPREAIEHLGGALRLWLGSPYQGLEELEPLPREIVRLHELRLHAIELLAKGHLAIDQPGWVCELLAPEVRDNPLRDSLAELLMLALFRSGRVADALRVFARLREALDEELGVEPSQATKDLEERIILGAPELKLPRERIARRSSVQLKSVPFVGRRHEARELDGAWAAVAEGGTRIALICGAAGIGKTALADQLATRATREGATVLAGHCDPDPIVDYQPFPSLVRAAILAAAPGALTAPILGELRRIVPDLADQLPPVPEEAEPTAGRRRLFAAVARVLAACPSPVLLVIEGLHWADAGALALLRFIAREHEGPLMLVATYRDDEAGPETALGAALAAGELAEPDLRVQLRGLDVAALTALVDMLAPDLEPRVDIAQLAELTSGNPLFVREVVRELIENPSDVPLAELAPDGMRTLVGAQLQRLSPEAREVVSIASILGSEFALNLLAATAEMSETAVLTALDEALATRLVVETATLDVFTFGQPLVRNIISSLLPAHWRARFHLRAGETLAVSPTDGRWAEAARHFLAAVPRGDAARAARFAKRAGDDAADLFAHDDAATWYRAALRVGAGSEWATDERGETLLALGRVLERDGDLLAARIAYVEAAVAAREAGNAALLADVAIAGTSRYLAIDAFHDELRALIDEALEGDIDDRRRAELLDCGAKLRYYDEGDADRPYAEEAIELASRTDDLEVRAIGMRTFHRFLTKDPSAAEERLVLSRELRSLCEDASLRELIGVAAREVLVNLLSLGWWDQFDEELVYFDGIATTHDLPADRYWVSALRATRSLMTDSGADAEGMVRAATTLGRRLQQADAPGMDVLQMFALRRQQGRCHEVISGLGAPMQDQPRMDAGISLLACSSLESGRPDDARRIVDQVLTGGEVRFPRNNLRLGAVALLAGAVAEIGTDGQRALCRRELEPVADQWCVFGSGGAVFGTGHHWLGELAAAMGDGDAARRHLERACDLSAAASSPYWSERAQKALVALDD